MPVVVMVDVTVVMVRNGTGVGGDGDQHDDGGLHAAAVAWHAPAPQLCEARAEQQAQRRRSAAPTAACEIGQRRAVKNVATRLEVVEL